MQRIVEKVSDSDAYRKEQESVWVRLLDIIQRVWESEKECDSEITVYHTEREKVRVCEWRYYISQREREREREEREQVVTLLNTVQWI